KPHRTGWWVDRGPDFVQPIGDAANRVAVPQRGIDGVALDIVPAVIHRGRHLVAVRQPGLTALLGGVGGEGQDDEVGAEPTTGGGPGVTRPLMVVDPRFERRRLILGEDPDADLERRLAPERLGSLGNLFGLCGAQDAGAVNEDTVALRGRR